MLMFNLAVSAGLAPAINLPIGAVFGGISAIEASLSFLPLPEGSLMAVTKEIWLNDIVSNLFKANPHLQYAMNADGFVLNGKVVHIPNAGDKPNVERNRSKYPATVLKRTDIDITFSLDEFTSDPMLIDNAEQYELSYDKRASITSEQVSALAEVVGDWFFYYWAPSISTAIVRTSGSNVTAHLGTGTRKAVTVADVKSIKKKLDKMGVPAVGRVAQFDADMMDQFTDSLTATQYKDFSSYFNAAEGTIGKLFGFTFLDARATVLAYDNSSTPVAKAPTDASGTTDNGAALFWHKDMVIRALGQNEFFENIKDPTYYGDIYSALIRAGGRKKRNDGVGVVALVQAAGA